MNRKGIFLLILILALSLILRFYRLHDIYVFNFDEEYQASYAWTLVKDVHPIWIGVSSSFLDFYLGPYFTYFTAVLLYFSSGDPMLTAYFAAFLGVVTTGIIFFVGRKIFNNQIGYIASLLYATMPIFVFFDQKYWNPMFTPIIVLFLFLTLYYNLKSYWFWIGAAVLFGTVLNTHLGPAPLFLIGVYQFFKGGYWKSIKLIIISFLAFLIFYWPLIVFDFNHNFSNISSFLRIGSSLSQSKIAFNPQVKLQSLADTLGRFWYLKSGNPNADEINFSCNSLTVKPEFKDVGRYAKRTSAPLVLSILSLILIFYYSWVNYNSQKFELKLLTAFLMVAIFSFLLYPGASSEYYTMSILVLFTFVPGILISQSNKKLAVGLFGIIIIFSILGINTVLHTSDEFSLGPKKKLIAEVMKIVGQEDFAIEGRGICHNYEGWRYLFKVYGRVPTQSYTDDSLGWLYPKEIGKEKPAITVILSEDRIPLKEDLSSLTSVRSGGYRAYIRKDR